MSQINSLLAYGDCQRLFEAALADPKGARALIGTYEQCMNMRTRMHYFRNLDRKANHATYPEGHMLHGTSRFDPLVVRDPVRDEDNRWWIYVEPRGSAEMIIEGLSDGGLEFIDSEGAEVKFIEDKSNGEA